MSKTSKATAEYTNSPTKDQGRCRDCTMYYVLYRTLGKHYAGACTAVVGVIEPDAHCKFFKKRWDNKHG